MAGVVLAFAALSMKAIEARAEAAIRLCVPETAGKAVTSDGLKVTCAKEEKAVELPGPTELATLTSIMPDITYVAKGVGGKPTIQFKGVNVQIVSGSGSTYGPVNGEGNLVIGYDEGKLTQTGSHNLVLGTDQSFTSYGGLLAGSSNTITEPYASVTGGRENTVSREWGSITGGVLNNVKADGASVSGGSENTVENNNASISGGSDNRVEGEDSSISGGYGNFIKLPGNWASITGGYKNKTDGEDSAILGGDEQSVTTRYGLYP
jgi:hypothetical protein